MTTHDIQEWLLVVRHDEDNICEEDGDVDRELLGIPAGRWAGS